MRTDEQIIQLVKDREQTPAWVIHARERNKELNALVYGKNFHELLINQIEKIESEDRQKARKKYSIDVRDLFYRIMEPRQNVFSADGGHEEFSEELPKATKEDLKDTLQDVKGGKSIDEYLSKYLFTFSDVDPNGILFMEYRQVNGELEKVYPTYKCIQDIQDYEPDGLTLKWVLFKPITIIGSGIKKWRYVDEKRDVIITQKGSTYTILEEDDTINDFGIVPAVILSDVEEIGTNLRLSWLYFIEELSKKYARDRSVKTLYEFLQGFPKHWRYESFDNNRRANQQDDSDDPNDKTDERGSMMKPDVTDEIILPSMLDKEYDVKIAPDVAGYISPDLDTLKHMAESETSLEDIIEYTMWGTQKTKQGSNETATGRYIDIQPLQNKLHVFSDYTQNVHNLLVSFIIRLVYRNDESKENASKLYHRSYGRRFIIESPDVLLDKYNEARGKGAPTVILDRMLNEWITSKYKNVPELRRQEILKSKVEPYVHLTNEQIFNTFGQEGVNKKVLFTIFWDEKADKTKTPEQIREEFEDFFNNQNTITNE